MFRKLKTIISNKWVRVVGISALILGIIFVVWSLIPSNPTQSTLDEVLNDNQLEVVDKPSYIILQTKNTTAKIGFIFYPGAKIDSRAYLYKLAPLAKQESYKIYITKPFLHYAFTDIDSANKVISENSDMKSWVIGGHSLGGAMACEYIKSHNDIKVLVLIGSYCSSDISKTDKFVLSIVGSEDGLIDIQKIDSYKKNLPQNSQLEVIYGMNHAQAGNYGDQLGDKPAQSPDSFTRLRIITTLNKYLK
jgi:Alpha/beta hydrolase family